jgi:hypothetical protein
MTPASPRSRALTVAVWVAAVASGSAGCAAAEKAAAKDPVQCERDPSCARYRGRYPDCTKQCSDDPECVARCEEVQRGIDTTGHQ